MKTFNDLASTLAYGGRVIAARKAAAPASEKIADSKTGSSESRRWKALPSETAADKEAAELVHAVRLLSAAGFPVLAMAEAAAKKAETVPAKKAA